AYARIVAEPGLRIRDRDRITVDEQQAPIRPEPFEQASRVAAAPVGAVEIDAIGAHVESIERLLEQYRNVGESIRHAAVCHCFAPSASRASDRDGAVRRYRVNSSMSSVTWSSPMVSRILARCASSLHNSNLLPMPSRTAFFSMPAAPRWLAGSKMRPLPSGSTIAAAPTSFICRLRCVALTLDNALTWSRTRSHSACGNSHRQPLSNGL